jgi:hypothetical protein
MAQPWTASKLKNPGENGLYSPLGLGEDAFNEAGASYTSRCISCQKGRYTDLYNHLLGERKVALLISPKKPEYQVVLEFDGDDSDNFERVIACESKLEEELECGEVDGNDVGQGVVNIFIITEEPKRCFEEAMRIIGGFEPCPRAAGYRDLDGEDYVRLWPVGDATPFELK